MLFKGCSEELACAGPVQERQKSNHDITETCLQKRLYHQERKRQDLRYGRRRARRGLLLNWRFFAACAGPGEGGCDGKIEYQTELMLTSRIQPCST
jgi:hypothetical protein